MNWAARKERGSEFSLKLICWLARFSGRSFCRALLYPIAGYFMATDKVARKASTDYLGSVNGRPPTIAEVLRHFHCFATTLLDRVYLANHQIERFQITIENRDLVDTTLAKGHGCVLLGSHLGSFDIMALAREAINDRPLNIMMRVDPSARLRKIAGLDDRGLKIIPFGLPQSLLMAHQALEEGEVVAILADRIYGRSTIPVTLFGRPAKMPKSPYLLAARSNAPILVCFGVYEGGNRYRIIFVDPLIFLNNTSRGEDITAAAQTYAHVLEMYARQYPYNWFNFYPYWTDVQDSP